MTINSTTRKTNPLVGNGNTHTYPFAFKVFTDADIVVKKLEDATSTETLLTLGLNNDYIVTLNADQNGNPGGSITLKSGGNNQNLASGFRIVITSAVQSLQGTDLTNQGGFYPEVINDALDKSAILHQQQQDELDRSIKFSLTNTIGSLEITENANARKNKVLSFDNDGEFSVLKELGTYRGNWAASTTYVARDLVKDTSTNNIFMCNTAHTSTGAQPLTTNTHSAKWDLIVDAATATTSATNAAASASAAASSASLAANSATTATTQANTATSQATTATTKATEANTAKTAAETAKTAAEAAQTAAETALDSFDDRYLGAKASNPTVDNDGNTLIDGALYFNTTSNIMRVYDLGNTTWLDLNITGSNLTNVNTVAGIQANVNTVAGISTAIGTVAADPFKSQITTVGTDPVKSNIATVVTNVANINTVANKQAEIGRLGTLSAVEDLTILGTTDAVADMNTLASASNVANMSTLAGISVKITTVADNNANVTKVGNIQNNVNIVADNDANVTKVANIDSSVTAVANDATDIGTVATNIGNVNLTGQSIGNVNIVGNAISNVNDVATIKTNINTLASIDGNITTVAGISSNVTAVANDATDIGLVAGSIAAVNATGNSIGNVNTVAAKINEVDTVSTNITSVTNASNYLNNFLQLYLGEASSNPVVDGLGNAITEGDLYFNTVDKRVRVYNGSVFQNIGEDLIEVAKFATSSFSSLYTAAAGSNSIDLGSLAVTGAVFANEAITAIRASLAKGSGTYNLGGI